MANQFQRKADTSKKKQIYQQLCATIEFRNGMAGAAGSGEMIWTNKKVDSKDRSFLQEDGKEIDKIEK